MSKDAIPIIGYTEQFSAAPGATLSGGVRLDDGCHVGVGATIIQNVSIGTGAFVPAGAVVTSDLQPNERYG